jgi:hypothetical protein
VVEVNPIGKKELKWSEYKKVPVLVVDGEPMNDSTSKFQDCLRLNQSWGHEMRCAVMYRRAFCA